MARTRNKVVYQRRLNPISIPDHVKRDLILERDRVFSGNMKVVAEQSRLGQIDPRNASTLRDWLVMASLRRNHVPLKEARRMAVAG